MSASTQPFAVQYGEGRALPTPTGDTAIVKADTARTNGSLTVIELVVAEKQGPALHIHRREDELWYVISGEFRFKTGDDILRASTGGMAFGPRGTPHCFQNIGDETGRLLVITTPSGLERFFEEFAQLTPDGTQEQLATVAHRSWIDFIGPPVGESDPL
ncbi:MAG TPA: cupin domain-containing protein [Actinomycetales bacterium]|nr:cupin domain-containing protein [Actinomycetales bacterium]